MDVMFTTHPSDGPGKYYMAVATAEEWEEILKDLGHPHVTIGNSQATDKLIAELEGWGIG